MKKRFKVIAAVYLLLVRDNKILLLRRFNTGYQDGNYSLVSGHLEGGESARSGLIREAKEEVGIDLKPEDLAFVHVINRPSHGDDNERIELFFKARSWKGEAINKEPHKCDDLQWFDWHNLPSNLVPEVSAVLQRYQQGIYYSELEWD